MNYTKTRSAALKVWSKDLWGSPRPSQGVCKVITLFIIILRHYLSFSYSFSHERRVQFSRGQQACNDVIALTANTHLCTLVL